MKLEIKILIAQKVLLNILSLFIGSFFMAHLFEIAKENVVPIAVFNIAFTVSLSFAYLAFTGLLKRGKTLFLHRAGIMGHIVFLLALMILKQEVVSHLIILGVFFGFAVEAWWLPIHVFIASKISKSDQPQFQGYFNAVSGAATIIAPLILGAIIQTKSFEYTLFMAIGIAIVMFLNSFVLNCPDQIKDEKPLQLIKFFRRSMKDKAVLDIYFTEFLRGTYSGGALNVIVVIYAAYLFGAGLNLGLFLSAFACVNILVYVLFGRYVQYKHFPYLLGPIVVITGAVAFAFTFMPTTQTFLLYQFCFTALVPLIGSINSINFYNMSNRPDIKAHRVEFFGTREVFLNLGRVVSFALMFLFAVGGSFENMKYVLFLLTICNAISGIFALAASQKQEC